MRTHVFEIASGGRSYRMVLTQAQWNRMGKYIVGAFQAGVQAGLERARAEMPAGAAAHLQPEAQCE